MTRIRFAFALALLLVFAQQGALLHELSHIYRTGAPALQHEENVLDAKLCATCLAFSQVANPASSTLGVLPMVAIAQHRAARPRISIIAADAPAPKSRGPPIYL